MKKRLDSIACFFALVLTPLVTSTFDAEAQSTQPRRVPPNVLLLLDASASTYWGSVLTNCPYWNALHGHPGTSPLNHNEIIRAALTECWSADDGLIYKYARNAQLAAYGFGFTNASGTSLMSPFFASTASLEAV